MRAWYPLKSALVAMLVTAIVAVCSTVIIMSHDAMQQQHTAPAAATIDNTSDPSTQIPSDDKTPVNAPSANPADTEEPATDTGSENKGVSSLISAVPATDDIDDPKIHTIKPSGRVM